MHNELQALHINITWIISDLPLGKKPIGFKWVYNIKCHSNETIECYKARLVAKGYIQVEGIDFFDTYFPVAKLTSIRFLLATGICTNLMFLTLFYTVIWKKSTCFTSWNFFF